MKNGLKGKREEFMNTSSSNFDFPGSRIPDFVDMHKETKDTTQYKGSAFCGKQPALRAGKKKILVLAPHFQDKQDMNNKSERKSECKV